MRMSLWLLRGLLNLYINPMPYITSASKTIKAPIQIIWDAITKPEHVKEYFFGTNLVTTWNVGSPILFKGEWEGKAYEDKGTVLFFNPPHSLSYSYFSPLSGSEDKPESYQILTYTLEEIEGGVTVTIGQSNIETQEKADHSKGNWEMVLTKLDEYIHRS